MEFSYKLIARRHEIRTVALNGSGCNDLPLFQLAKPRADSYGAMRVLESRADSFLSRANVSNDVLEIIRTYVRGRPQLCVHAVDHFTEVAVFDLLSNTWTERIHVVNLRNVASDVFLYSTQSRAMYVEGSQPGTRCRITSAPITLDTPPLEITLDGHSQVLRPTWVCMTGGTRYAVNEYTTAMVDMHRSTVVSLPSELEQRAKSVAANQTNLAFAAPASADAIAVRIYDSQTRQHITAPSVPLRRNFLRRHALSADSLSAFFVRGDDQMWSIDCRSQSCTQRADPLYDQTVPAQLCQVDDHTFCTVTESYILRYDSRADKWMDYREMMPIAMCGCALDWSG